MSTDKTIHQRIKEKRDKLASIHSSLALHMAKELTFEQRAKAGELQDRLEHRTLVAEEALLDDKISIFEETLKVLRG